MYKYGSLPPRSLNSFGVTGVLGEQSTVFYESIFTPKHIGKVSDLLSARVWQGKLPEPVQDQKIRALTLFSGFNAYQFSAILNFGESLAEPIVLECGVDPEKIAIGVSFTLAQGIELEPEAWVARLEKGQTAHPIDSFFQFLYEHANQLVIRVQKSIRRVEVVSLIGLDGKVSEEETNARLKPVVVELVQPEQPPAPGSYVELGDVDYSRLLVEDRPGAKLKTPIGKLLSEAVKELEAEEPETVDRTSVSVTESEKPDQDPGSEVIRVVSKGGSESAVDPASEIIQVKGSSSAGQEDTSDLLKVKRLKPAVKNQESQGHEDQVGEEEKQGQTEAVVGEESDPEVEEPTLEKKAKKANAGAGAAESSDVPQVEEAPPVGTESDPAGESLGEGTSSTTPAAAQAAQAVQKAQALQGAAIEQATEQVKKNLEATYQAKIRELEKKIQVLEEKLRKPHAPEKIVVKGGKQSLSAEEESAPIVVKATEEERAAAAEEKVIRIKGVTENITDDKEVVKSRKKKRKPEDAEEAEELEDEETEDALDGDDAEEESEEETEEEAGEEGEEEEEGEEGGFKRFVKKLWPFNRGGAASEDESDSDADVAAEADGQEAASEAEEEQGESEEGASEEKTAAKQAEKAPETDEVKDTEDAEGQSGEKTVPEAAPSEQNPEAEAKRLVRELQMGSFDRMVTEAKRDLVMVKSEVRTAKAKAWADGFMSQLVSEKGKLQQRAKELAIAVRQKEHEFRKKEQALREEMRRKDDLLRQKTNMVARVQEQLAQALSVVEKLKTSGSSSPEETQLKFKLTQMQKLFSATKEENLVLAKKVEEMRQQVQTAQALAKSKTSSQAELTTLQEKLDKSQKQVEEMRKTNQQLQEKSSEMKKTLESSTELVDESKRKVEAAMKVATNNKKRADALVAKIGTLEEESRKLKLELEKAQTELRKASKKDPGQAA